MSVPDIIESFSGEYAFLSNFAWTPVMFEGIEYPTAEHAFAAAKTTDDEMRRKIALTSKPGEAKRYGRSVALRPDWDKRVRYEAMAEILRSKFGKETHEERRMFRTKHRTWLQSTGDALLVEGNRHHDNHWGDCSCPEHRETPGANHLGRLLMAIRSTLREDGPERWVRVGVTGHRDLDGDDRRWVSSELDRVLRKLRAKHGATTLINGMAMGADLLAAEAADRGGLSTWAYMPFPDQAANWPASWQERYEDALNSASRRVMLGVTPAIGGPRNRYLALLFGRNNLIVRDSDVIVAVHDKRRTTGGTVHAVKRARSEGLPVITLDPVSRTVTIHR